MKYIIPILVVIFTFSCQKPSSNTNATEISYKTISQSEFDSLAQKPNTVVIDVRTPSEVAEGSIPSADKFMDANSENFDAELATLDSSKTYLLYCKAGGRSSSAAQKLIDLGFKRVYDLDGGYDDYSK